MDIMITAINAKYAGQKLEEDSEHSIECMKLLKLLITHRGAKWFMDKKYRVAFGDFIQLKIYCNDYKVYPNCIEFTGCGSDNHIEIKTFSQISKETVRIYLLKEN